MSFTFHDNPDEVFLIFQFWRPGEANVMVGGVYIFTAPQPVQSPFTWTVPGGNYRGGGVWLRYTDGAGTYSAVEEADIHPQRLAVSPASLLFLAEDDGPSPSAHTLRVEQGGCEPFDWHVYDDAAWMQTQRVGDTARVTVDTSGLGVGTWQATVTVDAVGNVMDSPAQVPVTLSVVDRIHRVHLPSALRR